jgi:hypothetical protein
MDSQTSSTFKLTLNEENVNHDDSYHTLSSSYKSIIKITKIEKKKKRKKERKKEFLVTEQNNLSISFLTSEYDSNIMINSSLHHLL